MNFPCSKRTTKQQYQTSILHSTASSTLGLTITNAVLDILVFYFALLGLYTAHCVSNRRFSIIWGFSGKKWRFLGDFGTKVGILAKKKSIAQNA